MPEQINSQQFLKASKNACVIDVRTPKEFEQGHIPGAKNIPLFQNEERIIVGTLYKQEGRQPAILKGLELVGPKMATLVNDVLRQSDGKDIYIHCWRGGMRSGSMAWLLELYGLRVIVLKGGYKAFRNQVLSNLESKSSIVVLGGRTGSGKTHILSRLKVKGEQVIDLEKIANHKGSAFGSLGEEKQPSQEQFENELMVQLNEQSAEKKIWIEDESRLIGNKNIPLALWEQMRQAPVVYIDMPFEKRIDILVEDYGKFEKEQLKESILRISKKMGLEQTKNAIIELEQNNLRAVCGLCLSYYDKAYDRGLESRENIKIERIEFISDDFEQCASELIKKYK